MTNGEKYKTAEKRTNAFNYYCEGQDTDCKGCPLSNNKKASCRFAWLDLEAEAEEEKPMPCQFCGSETYVHSYNSVGKEKMYRVCCGECSYETKSYYNRDEAIAAHNRICKAVAAFKESEVK